MLTFQGERFLCESCYHTTVKAAIEIPPSNNNAPAIQTESKEVVFFCFCFVLFFVVFCLPSAAKLTSKRWGEMTRYYCYSFVGVS